jgi:hypothetical protein
MTLLVAAKIPSKRLNPKRRPIRFCEPGIVIAADTRFTWTWPNGQREVVDDAQKGWPLGNRTYAAYAGDAQLGERAILGARSACAKNKKWDNASYTLSALSKYLRRFAEEAEQNWRRPIEPTIVIVAVRKAHGKKERFRLYRLGHDDAFEPREREWVIEGDGRKYFEAEVLDKELDHFTRGKAAPALSGYKTVIHDGQLALARRGPRDLIDVPLISIANLIGSMVGCVIDDGSIPTVGGLVQLTTLGVQGIIHPRITGSSDGGATWAPITRHEDFRSHTDMLHRYTGGKEAEFVIPTLDEHCRFRDSAGWLTRIRTRPGSITGRPRHSS